MTIWQSIWFFLIMIIVCFIQFVPFAYFGNTMNYLTKSIRTLHCNGICIREIARRYKLAPSTVYRVIHGHAFSSGKRCPNCGALLRGNGCLACQLRRLLSKSHVRLPDKWDFLLRWDGQITFIRLELRPPEYERYLVVRKRKEEELNRIRFK